MEYLKNGIMKVADSQSLSVLEEKTFPEKVFFKILIIDDDDLLLNNVETMLKGQNYHTKRAGNGHEALRMANKWLPDIIISDILMPIMDGYEFCRQIRSHKKLEDAYFIYLTSKSDQEDMLHGLEIGGDDYLAKPFSLEELRARVFVGTRIIQQRNRIKALAKELARHESHSAVSSLCASMSHELNSPLGAVCFNNKTIKKHVDKLQMGPLKDSLLTLLKNNDTALTHIKRISSSIKKMTKNKREQKKVYVNISEEVDTALLLVSHRVNVPGVDLVKNLASNLPEFQFYEGALVQILVNIFINSLDAMNGVGRILLEASADDEYAYITISDDGPGIKPNIMPYIFDPLFSTKENGDRSGLGLSICRELAQENHSEIYVDNSTKGETIFTIKCSLRECL